MSNPMDTETPTGAVSSASASAHKKPSLRVLDQGPAAPATREEDLANGPSLLGVGTGAGGHEYPTIHSASDLRSEPVFEDLDHHHTETSMLPLVPLGLPTALSQQAMSMSELSDAGVSFSLPTGSLLSASVSHPEARTRQSTTDNTAAAPFVWEYEFSWEHSRLCFAGEPFDVVRGTEDRYSKASPDPETASTTSSTSYPRPHTHLLESTEVESVMIAGIGSFGDSVKSWAASDLLQDLEMASATCSAPGISSSSDTISTGNLNTQAPDPVHNMLGQQENIDWLVNLLLDDFFRSYAPRRSQRRKSTARNQDAYPTAGDLGTKRRKANTSITNKTGPQKRKTVGGSGESEDEGSRGAGQGTSSARGSRSSRSFACPLLKWKPQRYKRMCSLRHKTTSHVKHHLKKMHTQTYCPRCYKTFGQDQVQPHTCLSKPAAPVALITADKLKKIDKRANRRQSPKEQWQRLYKVLFPNEPPCFNPYLNNAEEEKLSHAEEYLRSERAQMIFQKGMQDMGFQGESRAKIFKFVFHQFLPDAWLHNAPDDEVHSSDDMSVEQDHDDDQAIEHPYPSETLDPNVISEIIPEDTDSYGLQQPRDPTAAMQDYSVPVLTGPSASIPGAFENQSSIEGIASGEPPNATEIGDLGLSGPDAFGPLTDGDFSHLLWSEGREAYETGLDLTWNV
ncbi:hypothetical protein B0T10DRAFT_595825 [Thelonectria olida]|uniref:Uncharacterized protein n=1 Tax=Thelonectria olida TaxID=1576542 RepID=A0A9P8VRS4_9HYPO|nr:hypothetical protein B0T10DRAFT_595825 [Thelonectria olida]